MISPIFHEASYLNCRNDPPAPLCFNLYDFHNFFCFLFFSFSKHKFKWFTLNKPSSLSRDFQFAIFSRYTNQKDNYPHNFTKKPERTTGLWITRRFDVNFWTELKVKAGVVFDSWLSTLSLSSHFQELRTFRKVNTV